MLLGAGRAKVKYIGSTSVITGSGTNISMTVPSCQLDDLLLVWITQDSGSGGDTWNPVTSWTKIYDRGGGNGSTCAFYKIAQASDVAGANYNFTTDHSDVTSGGMFVFRYAKFDKIGAAHFSDPIKAPSINVAYDNSMLVGLYANKGSKTTFGTPTGMTAALVDSDSNNPSFAVFYQEINSGDTGNRDCDLTNNVSYPNGLLLALSPI